MRPARARRRRGFWLDLFACFLIPAYTLLFAGSVEWLGANLSVIAVTGKDHYWGFVYWGALAGGYFAVMLTKLALILPRITGSVFGIFVAEPIADILASVTTLSLFLRKRKSLLPVSSDKDPE